MEVVNDLLNYNNLKIVQNTDWFNFSLDSVLLANFVKVNNKQKIIDFCSGNAPIPLFLSTKTKAKIIGVELQKPIFDLAVKSVKLNKLEDQISIINVDVKTLSKIYETDTFDLITCNPPYFKYDNNDNINDNVIKAIARHEIKLNLEDIFKCARKILKNNGKIAIVHKTDRLIDIIFYMKNNNLEPKRLQFIYPFSDSKSNLVIIEGAKNAKPGLIVEKGIIVHNKDGSYTNEILKIFNGGTK
ncbi:MAG TPA: tRNA1(Val) (adenine(37)-N6)-methyltransferase [Candidatus Aphodocola excrementigallinarum]|uniref:tRNA1(Val) (Adenine(37)-N6)-methyltransferase n=1 Tax=Candidatus Aphodocola excrementigallinarum TaxID=2840670 RepID=A0A9D1IPQ2_9FIRM|nr:tRNA1(Val) (adenine(37)-N6)-methyltransferase [Candidatus Aphodocola excrementigallinarum]